MGGNPARSTEDHRALAHVHNCRHGMRWDCPHLRYHADPEQHPDCYEDFTNHDDPVCAWNCSIKCSDWSWRSIAPQVGDPSVLDPALYRVGTWNPIEEVARLLVATGWQPRPFKQVTFGNRGRVHLTHDTGEWPKMVSKG